MSMMSSTRTSMNNHTFHHNTIPSELNPSIPLTIRQPHHRSHSLNFAAALNRRVSKRTGSTTTPTTTSVIGNQSVTPRSIHTLPIIQPDPYWNSYQNSRHFKIDLKQPRQQVTSLLALSSIPRPITPPLHEDSEPSAAVLIANVTRSVMEEEATNAAIAASLQTLEHELNVNHHESDQVFNSSVGLLVPAHHELNDLKPFDSNPFRKLFNSHRIQSSNPTSFSSSSSSSTSTTSTSSYDQTHSPLSQHQVQSKSNSISIHPFTS